MTFIEATEAKNKLHLTEYEYDGLTWQIRITPLDDHDFANYCIGYQNLPITDESAYNFTPKHTYKLRGMWTDGEEVKHDEDFMHHLPKHHI